MHSVSDWLWAIGLCSAGAGIFGTYAWAALTGRLQ